MVSVTTWISPATSLTCATHDATTTTSVGRSREDLVRLQPHWEVRFLEDLLEESDKLRRTCHDVGGARGDGACSRRRRNKTRLAIGLNHLHRELLLPQVVSALDDNGDQLPSDLGASRGISWDQPQEKLVTMRAGRANPFFQLLPRLACL
eukprot:767349-Hanusia_phi.AAC.3